MIRVKRSNTIFMDIVYALAALQGLIFTGFLLIRKKQKLANQLLAVYLIFICFSLFISYLVDTGLIVEYPHLLGLDSGITYLCGPFLWFYALILTGKTTQLKWRDAWHLVPFILHYTYIYIVLIQQPAAFKVSLIRGEASLANPDLALWSNGLKILHSFVYYAIIYKYLSAWEKEIQNEQALTKLVELKWLRWILVVILAISVVMTVWFMSYLILGVSIINALTGAIINVLLFVLVYAIVFFALKYPGLFVEGTDTERSKPEKYARSTLKDSESRVLWETLLKYMAQYKPYCEANLTISELARMVNLPAKSLSQVINENSGQNFFHFVNQHRVEEFKLKAIDPSNHHLTLQAIAMDCGFSSKSSFHSIFRKFEGCTPKQYIDRLKPVVQL